MNDPFDLARFFKELIEPEPFETLNEEYKKQTEENIEEIEEETYWETHRLESEVMKQDTTK